MIVNLYKTFGISLRQIPDFDNYEDLQIITPHMVNIEEEATLPLNFKRINDLENPRIIIISVSDNIKKTGVAKLIARMGNGLYWDLNSIDVNGTTFAGTVAHAVGVGNGAKMDAFFKDLKLGKHLVVLDNISQITSNQRNRWVGDFLSEVWNYASTEVPSIILTVNPEEFSYLGPLCFIKHLESAYYETSDE